MYIFISLWFDLFQNKLVALQPSWLSSGEEAVAVVTVVMKKFE